MKTIIEILLIFIIFGITITSLVTTSWGSIISTTSKNKFTLKVGLFKICNGKSCSSLKNSSDFTSVSRYLALGGAVMSLISLIAIVLGGGIGKGIALMMILGGGMSIAASVIFRTKFLKPPEGIKPKTGYSLYLNGIAGILSVMTAFMSMIF